MKTVNLLPEWYLAQARQRRRTRMHVVRMLCLAAALAGTNVFVGRHVQGLRQRDQALSATLAATPDVAADVSSREAELARLENIQLAYRELGSPVPMSAVIQQIQNEMTPGMALSKVAVEVQPEPVKGSGVVGNTASPPRFHDVAKLTVEGVSPNDTQVVQLIGKLTTNPLFTAVSLNYTRTEAVRDYSVRRFEIHMEMDVEQLGTEDAPGGGGPKAVAEGNRP
ncbi:MAG TPA: hypothetical protein VH253_07210 [Phycisphaerae bacterium]|nr:hypothetical protein [Phycisphaerae bacterium]